MKRTMIQRQVLALSEDLAEISLALKEEEEEAQRIAKDNEERIKKGKPLAPVSYRVTEGELTQSLQFVQERLESTIRAIQAPIGTSPRE